MRLLIACIGVVLCGEMTAQDNVVATYSSIHKTKRYEFTVTKSDVERSPTWKKNQDNPPFPVRKAIAAGRAQLAKLLQGSDQWLLREVVLHELGEAGKWIYVINFMPPVENAPVSDQRFPMGLVVLMNGRSVEPTITERK